MNPLPAFCVLLVLEYVLAYALPLRVVPWLAYFPIARKARFRYLTPEGGEDSSLPESPERRLDPSLETALRVVRDFRAGVRADGGRIPILISVRARWVRDELEISFRSWLPLLMPMLALSGWLALVVLSKYPGPFFLLAAVIYVLIPLLSLPGARRQADDLTLEILARARPSPMAVPFEVGRGGKLVPVRRPRSAGDGSSTGS